MSSPSAPVRLLPVVIAAILLFAVFRLGGHMLDEDPGVSAISPAQAQDAQSDATGDQVPAEAEPLDPEATGQLPDMASDQEGSGGDGAQPAVISASEQEVLASLQERRQALDQRESDLVLRERLLQATEHRIEQRIAELREIEAQIEASFGRHEEAQREQLQSLVGMYENMKPKDAARIFDRLDLSVLVDVVEQMEMRRMSPILAKMDPAVAERLTVELAARASLRSAQSSDTASGELQDP